MKVPPLTVAGLTGFWLLLATIALPAAPRAASAPGQEAPAVEKEKTDRGVTPLLSNAQLIGASITAGYGNSIELKLGRNATLSQFLRAAWEELKTSALTTDR